MNKKRYIITAALPYANGSLHIGHLCGVYIPADIFTRYLRLTNKKVIFISGSDEHGAPIQIKANKNNKSPKQIIDLYHKMIKKEFKKFDISFDYYYRTSNKLHHKISINFFEKLKYNKTIKQQESYQYYDKKNKEFLADRYVIGKCSFCNNDKAYGDQCEKCGSSINPNDLINPKSSINGNKIILKKTKNWYLLINKYQNFITKWIKNKKWKNNTLSQIKAWLKQGLKSRAITRDINWGIPINNEINKVLYVWFEAPIGYISATIAWAKKYKKNWKKFWQNNNTLLINFIGKDNIVFHGIIFPIILKSYQSNYILPYNIPANEFLNLENKKISTSKNWAVWIKDFIKYFPNQEDELRYYLISITPENKDSNFTWINFQNSINNELISILGNFINRTIHLCKKYKYDNVKKEYQIHEKYNYILNKIYEKEKKIKKLIKTYNFRKSLKNFMDISRIGNKFVSKTEPWKINDKQKIKAILNICIKIIELIIKLSYIFLPNTYHKLIKLFNINPNNILIKNNKNNIITNLKINNNGIILFKKITNKSIQIQLNKLKKLNKSL